MNYVVVVLQVHVLLLLFYRFTCCCCFAGSRVVVVVVLQVHEVIGVMRDNVTKVMEREGKLSDLDTRHDSAKKLLEKIINLERATNKCLGCRSLHWSFSCFLCLFVPLEYFPTIPPHSSNVICMLTHVRFR